MSVLVHLPLPAGEAHSRGARRFELAEILDALRPWAEPLVWRIDDLWALAGRGQVFLGHRGLAREVEFDGVAPDPQCGDLAGPLSFRQVSALARLTHQVVDGLFVGTKGPDSVELPRLGSHVEYLAPGASWFRACPLVVHAFDGSYWRVFAQDDAVADALRATFPTATFKT